MHRFEMSDFLSEEKIVEGCKKGDTHIQRVFFDRYGPKVMGVCMRYIPTNEKEEVFHDVIIKILAEIRKYKKGNLTGWVRTVATHYCIDYLRKKKRNPVFVSYIADEDLGKLSSISDDMEDRDLLEEKFNELHLHISKLPEKSRLILQLIVVDGFTHKEAGKVLGLTENGSKSLLKRVKKKLLSNISQSQKKTKVLNARS